MREIEAALITETVQEMCVRANRVLGGDMKAAFAQSMEREESAAGLIVLEQLVENARLAGALYIFSRGIDANADHEDGIFYDDFSSFDAPEAAATFAELAERKA